MFLLLFSQMVILVHIGLVIFSIILISLLFSVGFFLFISCSSSSNFYYFGILFLFTGLALKRTRDFYRIKHVDFSVNRTILITITIPFCPSINCKSLLIKKEISSTSILWLCQCSSRSFRMCQQFTNS